MRRLKCRRVNEFQGGWGNKRKEHVPRNMYKPNDGTPSWGGGVGKGFACGSKLIGLERDATQPGGASLARDLRLGNEVGYSDQKIASRRWGGRMSWSTFLQGFLGS